MGEVILGLFSEHRLCSSCYMMQTLSGIGKWDQKDVGSALNSATDLWSDFAPSDHLCDTVCKTRLMIFIAFMKCFEQFA